MESPPPRSFNLSLRLSASASKVHAALPVLPHDTLTKRRQTHSKHPLPKSRHKSRLGRQCPPTFTIPWSETSFVFNSALDFAWIVGVISESLSCVFISLHCPSLCHSPDSSNKSSTSVMHDSTCHLRSSKLSFVAVYGQYEQASIEDSRYDTRVSE